MRVNPNNCASCDHSKGDNSPGHCYMFRHEPHTVCMQHTGRKLMQLDRAIAEAIRLADLPAGGSGGSGE